MYNSYNYQEAVADSIREVIDANGIKDNWDEMSLEEWKDKRDDIAQELNDDLWTDDQVTGNGSGSYTFDREEAKGYVLDGSDYVKDALKEFDVPAEEIIDHFFDNDWEYFDVTARCGVLYAAIEDVLDEYEQDRELSE